MKKIVRVGTRKSELALAQCKLVIEGIKDKHHDMEFEIVAIKTKGDEVLDKRLDMIGGKGLFIKELENALIDHSIDLAVHSMKDMPSHIPDELVIAAVTGREDPRDVLVTADGRRLEELREGAVVGTGSIRRKFQILALKPDLVFKTLRGNILTRLNKLLYNEYDALVLAAAGLKRLGLEDRCIQYFSIDEVIPAPGQGIICVEARKYDDTSYLQDSVHSGESALQICAERAFMIKLNGGCSTPVAAHAVIDGERMKVLGMFVTGEKPEIYKGCIEGCKHDAVNLGEKLADIVMKQVTGRRR